MGMLVNGQDRGCNGLLLVIGERLHLRQADLAACGVPLPDKTVSITLAGEDYIALDAVSGLTARLDASGTLLLLEVSAERYAPVRIGPPDAPVAISSSIPAAYIDYDLTFTHDSRTTAFSALVDAAVSGSWGVLGTSALAGTGNTPNVRLASAYTLDFPERRMRLVVGDTLSRGAGWSQPVRLGGFRIGTDFSLDPARLTYPLPMLQGGSALPSTVELAAREGVQDFTVQPGLFSYAYRPQFSGAGDVTMIVRDIAGNQRVVTRSFYASTSQLRSGLAEFSVEGGLLRRDFGLRSFAYGSAFGAGSLRYGLTSALTLESRLESGGGVTVGGLGAQLVVQPLGEIRAAAALSGSGLSSRQGRTGALLQVQAQRLTRNYGITASYRIADGSYRQVGDPWTERSEQHELALSGSLALGRAGSVNLGYLSTRTGQARNALASASYSVTVGSAFLNLGAQRQSGDGGRTDWVFGMLTVPLGAARHLAFSADSGQVSAAFDKAVPSGSGLGYRAGLGREIGGTRGTRWGEGMATLRTSAGDIELAGLYREGTLSARAEARGALVAAGGEFAATQRVGDGFAVVDLSGNPGAVVMLENRAVPMTRAADEGGRVLVTGLVPYVANRVSIDPVKIPIEVPLGEVEQIVTPGWGKAVKVTFGRRESHPVRLHIVDMQGRLLDTGREVLLQDGHAAVSSTVTGYDGEVYLDEFVPGALLRIADGQGGHCIVRLGAAPPADGLAHPIEAVCQPEPQIAGS